MTSLNHKEIKLYPVKWIPFGFRAMCIPPVGILIKKKYFQFSNSEEMAEILKHENIHWSQYKRMGFFMFYFRYFAQLLIIGYDTMPMEMEARQGLTDEQKWNYRSIYHKN